MNKEYAKHLMSIYKDKVLYDRMTRRLDYLERIFTRLDDKRLFAELCFCLTTPQTKARNGWKAFIALYKDDLLFKLSESKIATILKKYVRFHNMKANHIVVSREKYFRNGVFTLRDDIKHAYNTNTMIEFRNKIAKEIKGLGLKEASHFLRNIGFGRDIAILDRHILREMEKLDILPSGITSKTTLTKKNYLEVESSLIEYANKEGIDTRYLDFVLWYDATDDIFK